MDIVQLENVEIGYRNFAGKESDFNSKGDRNFVAFLPADVAIDLQRQGWNIKQTKPREEGDEPRYYLPISVRFQSEVRPAHVVLISSQGRTTLTEDMVEMLDYAEISNVDLIVRPYQWALRDKTGVKAYLQSMYVTIVEDPLALKYAQIPEANQTPEVN